tara:strand:+ start:9810 stop:11306 length:1497 start_codon:yes stop_codon:yes gene_type:complete
MPVEITKTVISDTRRLVAADGKRRDLTDSKAPGLLLRFGVKGAKWSWKTEIADKTYRIEFGPVSEWTITEARNLAILASSMVRSKAGNPDAAWLHARRAARMGVQVPAEPEVLEQPEEPEEPPQPRKPMDFHLYNFKGARTVYLKEVERTLRKDTHRDYKQLLEDECLDGLADLKVSTITRARLARIAAVVHRSGRERYAEKLAGALRTMWNYLGTDLHTARSGVEPGVMAGLRAPTATRTERGAADPKRARKGRYVPPMLELGRILAIARSGAFDDAQSTAIELLVFAAQRRRPIVSCWRNDFVPVASGDRGLWRMPPAHRKTAAMRDDADDHVVPLPPLVWQLIQRRKKETNSPWLFPQYRARREGMDITHMSPEVLTRALLMMPGIKATPHDIRRAFGSHGEKELGWTKHKTRQILDHAEGETANDVTSASYSLHDGTHEKWPTMLRWVEYVEGFVQPAIDADPRLLDVDWLKCEIAKRRREIMGLDDGVEPIVA